MNNYQEKFEYLANRNNWRCPIALEKDAIAQVTDLHHYRVHNTKVNRKLYPLFIDSMLNLVAVNNAWHLKNPSWGREPYFEAEKYELFLSRHPKIDKFLNMKE